MGLGIGCGVAGVGVDVPHRSQQDKDPDRAWDPIFTGTHLCWWAEVLKSSNVCTQAVVAFVSGLNLLSDDWLDDHHKKSSLSSSQSPAHSVASHLDVLHKSTFASYSDSSTSTNTASSPRGVVPANDPAAVASAAPSEPVPAPSGPAQLNVQSPYV